MCRSSPSTRNDVDKLSTALYKMVKADPSLRLEVDKETGETVLKGMGELHLEVTIDRMRTELGVEANMGKPKVSFREAFGRTVEHIYTHKKQSGGSGQFAEVKMVFEPLRVGHRRRVFPTKWSAVACRASSSRRWSTRSTSSRAGQVAGYEVVDFKARLIDGKYHDVDSLGARVRNRRPRRVSAKRSE